MRKIPIFLILDLRESETRSVHNLCNNLLHSGVLYDLPNLKQVSLWSIHPTAYGPDNQSTGIDEKGAGTALLKKPSASENDCLVIAWEVFVEVFVSGSCCIK